MAKNLQVRVILQGIEEQFMKGSNFLADNVANDLQVRVILQDIEHQFMNKSNIDAEKNNLPVMVTLQNTKEQFKANIIMTLVGYNSKF